MGQAYTGFAAVYDRFMNNIPYDTWASYIIGLLKDYGINDGLICELGCGTGNMTRRLSAAGYDMIGIDISEDMLNIARDVDINEHVTAQNNILYLMQDMREFELYGTVSAIVSLSDSMNYILEDEDMKKVFKLVNNYLEAGGIFIFDVKTEYFYKEILGDQTIAENQDDCSIIWENEYFEDKMINQYGLTIYQKICSDDEEQDSNIYERCEEVHHQRAYKLDKLISLIEESGLEFVKAYEHGTYAEASDRSERFCIVVREKHQKNKLYV